MCYRTETYTVCRRVRESFSPKGLQAEAVKGLMLCAKTQHILSCLYGNSNTDHGDIFQDILSSKTKMTNEVYLFLEEVFKLFFIFLFRLSSQCVSTWNTLWKNAWFPDKEIWKITTQQNMKRIYKHVSVINNKYLGCIQTHTNNAVHTRSHDLHWSNTEIWPDPVTDNKLKIEAVSNNFNSDRTWGWSSSIENNTAYHICCIEC